MSNPGTWNRTRRAPVDPPCGFDGSSWLRAGLRRRRNVGNRAPGLLAASGFTLLEIVIVVTIMGLFTGLVLPRLPDVTGARVRKTARKVAMTFQLARTRAISLRRYYRVEVDVETNRVLVAYYGPEGTFIEDDTVRSYDTGDTDITDIVTLTDGKTREGTGWIGISPRGFTEPSLIHLRDVRGRDLTISPALASGRVRILEGYVGLGPG